MKTDVAYSMPKEDKVFYKKAGVAFAGAPAVLSGAAFNASGVTVVTAGVAWPLQAALAGAALGAALGAAGFNWMATDPPRKDYKNLVLPFNPRLPAGLYTRSDTAENIRRAAEDFTSANTQAEHVARNLVITLERLQGAEADYFSTPVSVSNYALFRACNEQRVAARAQISAMIALIEVQEEPVVLLRDETPTIVPELARRGAKLDFDLSKVTAVRKAGRPVLLRIQDELGIDKSVPSIKLLSDRWINKNKQTPWAAALNALVESNAQSVKVLHSVSSRLHPRSDSWFNAKRESVR